MRAAANGGKFTSTAIGFCIGQAPISWKMSLPPDPIGERASKVQLSADAAKARGGPHPAGTAFRTRQPCISNDYLSDFGSSGHFYKAVSDSGTRSGAALPLLKDGKAVGAIVFLSSELGAFSPELIGLLERLCRERSFALEISTASTRRRRPRIRRRA